MTLIQELITIRKSDTKRFDTEVWDFMDLVDSQQHGGSRLHQMTPNDLVKRLAQIELNIQYLDDGVSDYQDRDHNGGWGSPWWWYRARHWTLLEFQRRHMVPEQSRELAPAPTLLPLFRGAYAGGTELLVRVSRRQWLLDALTLGKLRFSPAAAYQNSALNEARADDEMSKGYIRPGNALRITTTDGNSINPIGDVRFATERRVEFSGSLVDRPYWMMSFSSDLDPRIFDDLPSNDPIEDAALVIFDVAAFVHRAVPLLFRAAPGTTFETVRNIYFDPYNPPAERMSAVRHKLMRYAYQREVRLVLDPGSGPPIAAGGVLEVEIGTLEDVAGVYDRLGNKIAGSGPPSFLANV
ncbi:hypothetical protein IHQ71_11810 [Rhizobium sp. TH2]|uniref:hypothetical protein n=1 Tax=Rhizobium sp. TH2 TaxID=2775403 RepID=UPI0021572CC1|nr:hypothetical protein [Rhizobium sp. TH2]UVC11193.1 hypothetical protein IHQ71_11810 [Rhizobium sp. TH2]